uniref:RRM domain-containing protein n=1 Tax=Plectus sambesii TaxID=2011161 RepID=A0A914VIR2_9BILA
MLVHWRLGSSRGGGGRRAGDGHRQLASSFLSHRRRISEARKHGNAAAPYPCAVEIDGQTMAQGAFGLRAQCVRVRLARHVGAFSLAPTAPAANDESVDDRTQTSPRRHSRCAHRQPPIAAKPSVSMKRGPEDLLSPLSNGAGLSPQQTVMTVDNDAKKAKLDSSVTMVSATPMSQSTGSLMAINASRSRVVHLRNIPSDMTDVELIHLCIPFGKITNFLLLKGKNQAFVEYEDDIGASSLVSVSQTCPMAIRGRTIFCQFSNHQELKTDNKNAFNVPSVSCHAINFNSTGHHSATLFSFARAHA